MAIITIKDYAQDEYYVYALLCQDGTGPLYIKFGLSKRITKRMLELRNGCPVPARYFAIYHVGSEKHYAEDIEQSLHEKFSERRLSGEWFKFDSQSIADKREFNDGCWEVFTLAGYRNFSWTRISVESIVKYQKSRQKAFMAQRKGLKLKRWNEYQEKRRKTWKELETPFKNS